MSDSANTEAAPAPAAAASTAAAVTDVEAPSTPTRPANAAASGAATDGESKVPPTPATDDGDAETNPNPVAKPRGGGVRLAAAQANMSHRRPPRKGHYSLAPGFTAFSKIPAVVLLVGVLTFFVRLSEALCRCVRVSLGVWGVGGTARKKMPLRWRVTDLMCLLVTVLV